MAIVNNTKKRRLNIGIPAIISLSFHALVLLILGGVILFPGYVQNTQIVGNLVSDSETELEPPSELDIPEEDTGGGGTSGVDVTAELQQIPTIEDSQFTSDILTSTALETSVNLPAAGVSGMEAMGRGILGSGGGAGGGKGGGLGKGIGKASGTLFGTTIEAQKLGVIVDMSGSMRRYKSHVLKEIANNFRSENVVIVLQRGSGMGLESDSKLIQKINPEDKEKWKPGKWMPALVETYPSYYLDAQHANLQALETFKELEVDVIYWFADFKDKFVFDNIRIALKKNRMKLFIHYPKFEKPAEGDHKNKLETITKIAKKTGGEVIQFDINKVAEEAK